jgi:ribosomal protein S20
VCGYRVHPPSADVRYRLWYHPASRPRGDRESGPAGPVTRASTDIPRKIDLAHSSRGWTGARTPQALKRVRQAARRHAVLQPRRSAAKTFVAKAVDTAQQGDAEATREALRNALSALDRAAKVGAIHANAAARRKSRLTLKLNAVLGGESVVGAASSRQTGKAAAAKAAKSRIAAGKAAKAKGEQTAAGKARAALSRSTRESQSAASSTATSTTTAPKAAPTKATAKAAPKTAAKSSTAKASTAKTSTAKAPAAKSTAAKSTAAKSSATKSTAKASASKSSTAKTSSKASSKDSSES